MQNRRIAGAAFAITLAFGAAACEDDGGGESEDISPELDIDEGGGEGEGIEEGE